MIERKEKSPRLLAQTMGDVTRKNPPQVYPLGVHIVKTGGGGGACEF
jgi:hypothetical protein